MAADQMFFVSLIQQDGEPGRLLGPYYQYSEAEEVLRAQLVEGNNDNGPVEIDEKVDQQISQVGSYPFEGNGGLYIIQPEYPEDEDEDEDDEESA